ncbi:MAG: TRAP transporter TatT component family protein [Polyangiales bacterium]
MGDGMPANIIQVEGILRVVPDNQSILLQAIKAYVGYGYGWIEDKVDVADANDRLDEADAYRDQAQNVPTRDRSREPSHQICVRKGSRRSAGQLGPTHTKHG